MKRETFPNTLAIIMKLKKETSFLLFVVNFRNVYSFDRAWIE